ncbi:MAG: proton-conducting transporter transmembrane domain-containing protein [Acidithiobacillus sp.]
MKDSMAPTPGRPGIMSVYVLLLLSAVPLLLWVMGFLGSVLPGGQAPLMARLSNSAAGLSFISAAVAALMYAVAGNALTVTAFSFALPRDVGALALSVYINAVTVIMLTLVSFIGFVVARYARNYLQGDKYQGRFYTWLNLTLASILTLIISGNMLMFVLAWIATSVCLHQLLMFYPERAGAVLAARKKFIASRVGEVSLLIAVLLIGFTLQFPLQGWLIQVMEAPTPVSALLHAGIVNGGAFLIIRMSPILSQAITASDVLAIIGLVTIAAAGLVMPTQTSIKVFLAWTTTAQMGFMLLECGLGVYSLAMLHLVAHSLYKAHAFLSSGSGVDVVRAPAVRLVQPIASFLQWGVVLAIAGLVMLGIGAAFGLDPERQPALLALGVIVAAAMTQLLLHSFKAGVGAAFIARAAALSVLVITAYFSLHAVFHFMLATSFPAVRLLNNSPAQYPLIGLVMLVFFALLLIQQSLPVLARYAVARRAYVHLHNGLYVDIPFSRLVQRFWPVQAVPSVNR